MEKVRNLLYGDNDIYEGVDIIPFDDHIFGNYEFCEKVFREQFTDLMPKIVIEVGSWVGTSAIIMAKILKELKLDAEIICIDTWLGSVEHWSGEICTMSQRNGRPIFYETFLSNVIQSGMKDIITPFPIDSTNGLLFFKKFNIPVDFIYIDGAHDFKSVCNDLYNAQNVLRPSGVLLGDDWQAPDVRQAVYQTFGKTFVQEAGNKFKWTK